MTEAEWLACAKPARMLVSLRASASERKLRLFGCACCRLVWDVFPDAACRAALEVAERYADGLATNQELFEAHQHVSRARDLAVGTHHGFEEYKSPSVRSATFVLYELTDELHREEGEHGAWEVVKDASEYAASALPRPRESRQKQSAFLRDVFRSPLSSPSALDLRHLIDNNAVIGRLAGSSYEECAFHQLPILADALEDAGCTDRDILDHLRGAGPHVRGCWALDLILGKS
jgi:hypothetical protein